MRRARALLSLLISAGLTSVPTESNCDSSRRSATLVPDRRRNRAAAPPAAFGTARTARTFRTSRAQEVLDPLTHHAAALSPRGVSLSTRPGDSQPTFTRTEVLNSRSRSGSDSLLGGSRPGDLRPYRFRRTSPTVNSDLLLGGVTADLGLPRVCVSVGGRGHVTSAENQLATMFSCIPVLEQNQFRLPK